MWRYSALSLVLLAACNSPHSAFYGVEPQTITVDGSTFLIRLKDGLASATRTNFEYVPKIGGTFPKATKAMEIASNCTVVPGSMHGDAAWMVARLDCS